MSDEETINPKILKKLQDALSAEYIYTEKINSFSRVILINNLLAFSVPIVVLTSLYLTKGTPLEGTLNTISTISSLIILILTGFMFITAIPDNKERFIVARRINRRMQKECRNNLYKFDDDLTYFFNHVHDIDDDDLDKLGKISTKERQAAYRYALENLDLGCEACCATCGKSPSSYNDSSKCNGCGLSAKKRKDTNASN